MKLACDAGSLPHFSEHLAPIWLALPDEYKDGFYARGRAHERARQLGIEVDGQGQARRKELVLVASYEDHRRAQPAKTILVNHGVGQRYIGSDTSSDHPSYTGGRNRENVALFICPSESDAEACRVSGAPAVAAGPCKMDDWYNGIRQRASNDRPVVAISFHSDVHVAPESRSAFSHYQQAIIDLARDPNRPFDLLGHGHPRWGEFMAKFWRRQGVPFARHFDEVLEKADMYVCDNSSTMYEFASTDRPVLTLNAPWYRKDVHHGLRFWEAVPGYQIDDPDYLCAGIIIARGDSAPWAEGRKEAVREVYGPLCDGNSTVRAVAAIESLLATR